jgi:hypothetical protein
MRSLVATRGLPQIDPESWVKGVSDGRRGSIWWPGHGTEPLSYSVGYTEAEAEREAVGEPPAVDQPIRRRIVTALRAHHLDAGPTDIDELQPARRLFG